MSTPSVPLRPPAPPTGPDLRPSFSADPYGASRAWLAEWPWPPLRRTGPGRWLAGAPDVVRTVLRSTDTPFFTPSASFGRVDGWTAGGARLRPLVAALGRHLDRTGRETGDEALDAYVREVTTAPGRWPHVASLRYARLLTGRLLTGAPPALVERVAAAAALSGTRGAADGALPRLRRAWSDSRAAAALAGWTRQVRAAPRDGFQRELVRTFGTDDQVAFAFLSLAGAAARAAVLPPAWALLLDRGWRPGVPAGTVLPARPVAAPPADRIREALRLWPTAAILEREVVAPVRLAGTDLVRGDVVDVCVWALHRDPGRWEDAGAYRPDRWRDPPAGYRDAYLPYGTGAGACVAARFVNDLGARVLAAFDRAGPYGVEVLDDGPAFGALLRPPRFRLRAATGG